MDHDVAWCHGEIDFLISPFTMGSIYRLSVGNIQAIEYHSE
jgi:hypothetical protein